MIIIFFFLINHHNREYFEEKSPKKWMVYISGYPPCGVRFLIVSAQRHLSSRFRPRLLLLQAFGLSLKQLSKHSKNDIWSKIWIFSFQICFRNQFWTSGSVQTENTRIRTYVDFQFDHFLKSKIDSESRFEKKMSIFLF